jgi:glycosyltransferase involved in cell wall biosynthesis
LVQTFLFHANVVGTKAALTAGVPHVFAGMRVADPRKWRLAVERWGTSRAERFVCVSQNVAEAYRWAGFDSEKLVVIPNGVDLARFDSAANLDANPLGLAKDRRAILFVGRLDKQKGLDRFFHELPAIFRALPQHDLVLVGSGPLKDSLARLAARLRIADRVQFLGWQPDATSLISAADILVLPSRWEGMPNVVLEAMAAGKPVVATQAEGTVELLGIAAIEQTAAVGNWRGLRERLLEIAQNPQLSADLGQRNRSRAAQFSIHAMVQRYERLYDAALTAK